MNREALLAKIRALQKRAANRCALLGADIMSYISRGTRHLCIRTTDLQAAEIEYQYDYFRHLYRDEEEMLFVAFLHKHNLFPKDGDSSSEEVDPEYLARIVALMHGLNDSRLRKALPEEGR